MSQREPKILRRTFEIINRLGLHARAAGLFAETANQFRAEVRVTSSEQTVDGKSIIELMLLAAARGSTIEVATSGPDAVRVLDAIGALIAARFHEPE